MGVEKEILKPGDGATKPVAGNTVTMHYTGTLTNGTKFDSSVDRGQPFQCKIGVGQVIKGWDVGVLEMTLGEKAILKITSDFAYGASGAGGVIPPNADLNFEVELFQVLAQENVDKCVGLESFCCKSSGLCADTLASANQDGVEKEILKPGDGVTKPVAGNTVTMHYTGTLTNGTKFDSSVDRGKPFQCKIGVGQVIKGWDVGVLEMTLGEKAILKITSDFAYGASGAGGVIPPNADLNFEVELLAIN
eukprot:CAMPEP_0172931408 /NCGR_PEP_ID=MMETSP1075-20121228/219482_1 /TAXON_ID=2916 /ORGANISM="Ceratium fusus, Strain PA161109" /LENGTH=247 /DNA_ID=CAMNT_0013792731 /DNA_START=81 /DNA_END=825 /DNA_ORIENTATION=-